MRINIGCSGWFYWHWREVFYPADRATKNWFRHYSAAFDTVELNAPFYRWPTLATVKAWRRAAPEGFRYSVKVNLLITHEKRLVRTRKLIRDFYFIAEILGPRIGCFLFQFPPSYRYTPSRLKSLTEQLDPSYHNAIEFRHRSWWRQSVYQRLREHRLIFCSISGPRLPEELVRTSDILYLRFHGRSRWYRHNYSPNELAEWTEKILQSGAREAWIYFNNDREGFAIQNARELRRQLRRSGKMVVCEAGTIR
jgi:uncharacterized protein YecE (DUF72 family)